MERSLSGRAPRVRVGGFTRGVDSFTFPPERRRGSDSALRADSPLTSGYSFTIYALPPNAIRILRQVGVWIRIPGIGFMKADATNTLSSVWSIRCMPSESEVQPRCTHPPLHPAAICPEGGTSGCCHPTRESSSSRTHLPPCKLCTSGRHPDRSGIELWRISAPAHSGQPDQSSARHLGQPQGTQHHPPKHDGSHRTGVSSPRTLSQADTPTPTDPKHPVHLAVPQCLLRFHSDHRHLDPRYQQNPSPCPRRSRHSYTLL